MRLLPPLVDKKPGHRVRFHPAAGSPSPPAAASPAFRHQQKPGARQRRRVRLAQQA